MSTLLKGWAASTPASIRRVEPELPQSRSRGRGLQPTQSAADYLNSRHLGARLPSKAAWRETTTPSCSRQRRVLWQSLPGA